MIDILNIFKAYNGTGYYCILFIGALIYLWFTEENKTTRALLVITPTIIQVLFFIPYFYMLYNRLDAGTYYRILWILPMTLVIAYVGCKVIGNHTRMGLLIMSIILMISGSLVYRSVNISRAQNYYHLPKEAVDICDMMMPEEGRERVWAVVPPSLVHYIRQYSTRIQLAFGRDKLVNSWISYDNALYDLYCRSVIPVDELSKCAEDYYCNYIVLEKNMRVSGELEDYDIILIGETENYYVYRNEAVPFWDDIHTGEE